MIRAGAAVAVEGIIEWAGLGFGGATGGGWPFARTFWPELTFSLVLTAATLLEGLRHGKRFLIFFSEAEHYLCSWCICEGMGCGNTMLFSRRGASLRTLLAHLCTLGA